MKPAFWQRRTPEQDLAYCASVMERIGLTGGKAFAPIDPRYHSVSVPEPYKHVYSYEDNPWIVRNNAINLGVDALRTTLRAEALAREALLAIEGLQPSDDVELMRRTAQGCANALTNFHRDVWGIREPASDDPAQRELHARSAAKRKINGLVNHKYEDIY